MFDAPKFTICANSEAKLLELRNDGIIKDRGQNSDVRNRGQMTEDMG